MREVKPSYSGARIRVKLPVPRVRYPIFNKGVFVGWWTAEIVQDTATFEDGGVTFTVLRSPEGWAEALLTNVNDVPLVEATSGYLASTG